MADEIVLPEPHMGRTIAKSLTTLRAGRPVNTMSNFPESQNKRAWPESGLTGEIHDLLVSQLTGRNPVTKEDAAALVGVTPATLRKWLKQGAKDLDAGFRQTPHARLNMALRREHTQTLVSLRKSVQDIGDGQSDWRAHAWLHDALSSKDFGKNRQVVAWLNEQLTAVLNAAQRVLPAALYDALLQAIQTELVPTGDEEEDDDGC